MTELTEKDIGKIRPMQAELAQAKRSLQSVIAGLDNQVSDFQARELFDAMEEAMRLRSDLQRALADVNDAHRVAGAALRRIFSNGDIVVMGGGGR